MEVQLSNEDIMRLKLISKFFKGFADYSRLLIFESLMDGEKTVTEIIEYTGFSQSKISNHLKCLRESDLVQARQEGKFIYYSIADEKIKTILVLSKELIKDASEEKYNCMKY
ncbi:DNA-binding transcriptional ArsR family regulator [Anaerosolibacter carboniphilus]|uniref:DNA-binding transcriptional ArsR family regulator n=1 Tax=Anaerosolibacter carboniphilus TaxID=1417629 RepID=A0A841KNS5_9FIRM|nr:metalloregulator ArsR/SmtB family transcription factor [Anaerosolibacter carboniphilus]MBB6215053.1 DNA-binding transcriptional ArsR family regulator [Anaerosolibacter carboniphilus]